MNRAATAESGWLSRLIRVTCGGFNDRSVRMRCRNVLIKNVDSCNVARRRGFFVRVTRIRSVPLIVRNFIIRSSTLNGNPLFSSFVLIRPRCSRVSSGSICYGETGVKCRQVSRSRFSIILRTRMCILTADFSSPGLSKLQRKIANLQPIARRREYRWHGLSLNVFIAFVGTYCADIVRVTIHHMCLIKFKRLQNDGVLYRTLVSSSNERSNGFYCIYYIDRYFFASGWNGQW